METLPFSLVEAKNEPSPVTSGGGEEFKFAVRISQRDRMYRDVC